MKNKLLILIPIFIMILLSLFILYQSINRMNKEKEVELLKKQEIELQNKITFLSEYKNKLINEKDNLDNIELKRKLNNIEIQNYEELELKINEIQNVLNIKTKEEIENLYIKLKTTAPNRQ